MSFKCKEELQIKKFINYLSSIFILTHFLVLASCGFMNVSVSNLDESAPTTTLMQSYAAELQSKLLAKGISQTLADQIIKENPTNLIIKSKLTAVQNKTVHSGANQKNTSGKSFTQSIKDLFSQSLSYDPSDPSSVAWFALQNFYYNLSIASNQLTAEQKLTIYNTIPESIISSATQRISSTSIEAIQTLSSSLADAAWNSSQLLDANGQVEQLKNFQTILYEVSNNLIQNKNIEEAKAIVSFLYQGASNPTLRSQNEQSTLASATISTLNASINASSYPSTDKKTLTSTVTQAMITQVNSTTQTGSGSTPQELVESIVKNQVKEILDSQSTTSTKSERLSEVLTSYLSGMSPLSAPTELATSSQQSVLNGALAAVLNSPEQKTYVDTIVKSAYAEVKGTPLAASEISSWSEAIASQSIASINKQLVAEVNASNSSNQSASNQSPSQSTIDNSSLLVSNLISQSVENAVPLLTSNTQIFDLSKGISDKSIASVISSYSTSALTQNQSYTSLTPILDGIIAGGIATTATPLKTALATSEASSLVSSINKSIVQALAPTLPAQYAPAAVRNLK
jgi:hypothetical protein